MKILSLIIALFCSTQALADYATMDTADILPPGGYRVMAAPSYSFTGDNDGSLFSGRFDMNMTQDTQVRGLVGFGPSSTFIGGFVKWTPYPDFKNQPGISGVAGVIYDHANYNSAKADIVTIRLAPLVSKKFDTDIGAVIPYASLPMGIQFAKGDTNFPVQLAGGAEVKPYNWKNFSLMGEIGLDVNKAYSYVEAGGCFYWGDEAGKK